MNQVKPPKGLSPEGRRMWKEIIAEYGIDDSVGLQLLRSACEAFDICQMAQSKIRAEGMTITDRHLQVKPHPLLAAMRDARSSMLNALKALNCDLEPLRDKPGRPPGTGRR